MTKREERRLLTLSDGISARTAVAVLEALVALGEELYLDPATPPSRRSSHELATSSPVLRTLSDGVGVYVDRYSRLS